MSLNDEETTSIRRRDHTGPGRRRGGPHRKVRVKSVIRLSEHLTRIVAVGDLDGWESSGDGGHFKVFLPQADGTEAMRTYTARHYDAERGELTIDFALHADGPATRFARAATGGEAFEIFGGARPPYSPAEDSAWTVMVADQSALPAVCAIAESLPSQHRLYAVIEVPDLKERLAVDSPAQVTETWLAEGETPCAALVEYSAGLRLPDGRGEAWVGCEAGAMRVIRRRLLGDLGMSPERVHTRAYWKRGVSAHSDHDTGEEVLGEQTKQE